MDSLKKQHLLDAGIAVEDALARFLGNEALLLRFLGKFAQDPNFSALCAALEEGRTRDAFLAAHTLKGVTGNLSMQALFTQISDLVEDLRREDLEAARTRLPAVRAQYQRVLDALAVLQES